MNTSLKRRSVSKPEKGVKIHPYDLGVARGRNKNKAHELILELFQKSDLTKADLARMLGKEPAQITRWLAGPGNLTLDTLSDLIFAVKGDFFEIQRRDDLSRAISNRRSPIRVVEIMEHPKWKPLEGVGVFDEDEKPSLKRNEVHSETTMITKISEGNYERVN